VAANEEVAWDVGNVPLFSTGEAKQITVEITNTGNTPLQRQVMVTEPEDWSVEVDGNDIVSLDVGQATLVRLTVRGDVPGSASIGLSLSQSTASQASYSVVVTAEGEPIGTSANAGLSTTVAIALFVAILLVAFAALGIQAMRSRSDPLSSFNSAPPLGAVAAPVMVQPKPTVPVMPAMAAAAPTPLPTPAATPPPMCWTCRQPITTAMLGCPSCGARYHSDGTAGCQASTVQRCVNCQASAEHFVKA
jgi:hypothetical protein